MDQQGQDYPEERIWNDSDTDMVVADMTQSDKLAIIAQWVHDPQRCRDVQVVSFVSKL